MILWHDLIVALIGLFIGTLLGNELNRFLYRPNVLIKFRNISVLRNEDGAFWSILVANTGRTCAENCIGCITIFNLNKMDLMEQNEALADEQLPRYKNENIDLEYPRSQLTAPSKYRDLKCASLCWSHHGNPYELNINPGMVRGLDICRIQYHDKKKYWYLIFPSEKGWRKIRLRCRLKSYKGRLFICPANEFPKSIDFEIFLNNKDIPVFKFIKRTWIKNMKFFLRRKSMILDDH
ncbi:hypothetical protein [Kordia sp.]|uniref:hypothetical protein n=1 Tax=Kordia sp. TaxID=1965332 RepID=UPI003D2AC005